MKHLKRYLQNTPYANATITEASCDASFRKYYRLTEHDTSYILMDASREKESLLPFVNITKKLEKVSLHPPKIFYEDLQNGYLVLEDFGDTNLLDLLNEYNFTKYYKKAIDIIVQMQDASTESLPLYDKAFLHQEMDLMQEWYLEKKLNLTLTQEQQTMLNDTLNIISDTVLLQPQNKFVHRDFHSRNIMITPEYELGIIDYQDAMSGAITYDLVSLLKDCYIAFESTEIEHLALYFKEQVGVRVDDATFIKWFDFMGMQRHIKVLGIFSRLYLRDGKEGYLKDIPLTRRYLIEAAQKYPQTQPLAIFLQEYT